MLGSITLADDRDQFIQKQKLGPDGLSKAINAKMVGELVRSRKGSIKPLLMDQSLIVGIGNVYTDEIRPCASRFSSSAFCVLRSAFCVPENTY